jgi:hypothetical protein
MAILRHSRNKTCPRRPHPPRRATPRDSGLLHPRRRRTCLRPIPGSVKGKSLAHDRRITLCVSDERQPYSFVTIEGEAQVSAAPDQITHIAARIANRYYPSQLAEDFAESFVQAGFTAVRISITNVIARSGLG